MPMLVGFHVEGWDYLILRAYLAKLLELPEDDLEPDRVDASGSGWQFVLTTLPKALRRFYQKCAQLAVIGLDNDGNEDVLARGVNEDPLHPRHWLHADRADKPAECRFCQLQRCVEATRAGLNWIPNKPSQTWPVVIAVPVEAIESWLLCSQAIVDPGHGSLHAERERRLGQKQRLYGKPGAIRTDVENVALPLIRSMQAAQFETLETHCQSYALFANQVRQEKAQIVHAAPCW